MSSQKINNENHCSALDSDFRFFKNAFLQGLVSSRLSQNILDALADPNNLLQQGELYKDSNSTTAGVVVLEGEKFFLKRYNNKDFKRRLKNSVRKTRPFKVLNTSRAVAAAGVCVPEVFAALNLRRGLLIESSYLLSAYLENAQNATQKIEMISSEDGLETFVDKICRTLVKIHDAGIQHGDAKMSNILIIPEENSYRIGLLDFDGSTCNAESLSERGRRRDLARLVSSYLLTCKHGSISVSPLEDLIEYFAGKYQQISGVDLRGERLFRRTEYLSTRVRK